MNSNIKHKLLLKAVNHSDVCIKKNTINLLSKLN